MTDQNQPPQWGKKKGPSSPEELIAALLKKIKDSFEGGSDKGSGGSRSASDEGGMPPGIGKVIPQILLVVAALFVVNILSSSFYTIEPGEQGLVLRFGKFLKITNPGLNFKVPLLDSLYKVDVETVRKEEFGFRTRVPGQKTTFDKRGYQTESLMLTGDKNVIDVAWIVQYKVSDPLNFIFKVKDPQQAVRDVSEKAIRRVVGNQDFDFALQNREIIETRTTRELQSTLDVFESGIRIVTVKLQDVNPPETVKPAFNEVNEADQDMKRLVNEAEETYNRVIPKAKGSAKQILEEAHGYAVERVNLSQGEVGRFLNILREYSGAKEVTRRRMYLETMEKILPEVESIYMLDESQKSILPLFDISKNSGSLPGK
nr:FtsH protease activity modulator HflK [Desulfobulbaceae bacterium]